MIQENIIKMVRCYRKHPNHYSKEQIQEYIAWDKASELPVYKYIDNLLVDGDCIEKVNHNYPNCLVVTKQRLYLVSYDDIDVDNDYNVCFTGLRHKWCKRYFDLVDVPEYISLEDNGYGRVKISNGKYDYIYAHKVTQEYHHYRFSLFVEPGSLSGLINHDCEIELEFDNIDTLVELLGIAKELLDKVVFFKGGDK